MIPGTQHVYSLYKGDDELFFCGKHERQITPVIIQLADEQHAACELCFWESLGDALPGDAEPKDTEMHGEPDDEDITLEDEDTALVMLCDESGQMRPAFQSRGWQRGS